MLFYKSFLKINVSENDLLKMATHKDKAIAKNISKELKTRFGKIIKDISRQNENTGYRIVPLIKYDK